MLSTVCTLVDGAPLPIRFEVTTSTGYLAMLPACRFDSCLSGDRINCVRKIDAHGQHSGQSIDAWCKHIETHCHGYHLPLAEAFRDKAMKTYRRVK